MGRGRVIPVFVYERSVVAPQTSKLHREASLGQLVLATRATPLDRLAVCSRGGLDRQRQPAPWRVHASIPEDLRAWHG